MISKINRWLWALLGTAILTVMAIGVIRLTPPAETEPEPTEPAVSRLPSGPEIEKYAFEQMHHPYGVELPRALLDSIVTQIDQLDDEPPDTPGTKAGKVEPPWEMIGPQTALIENVTKNDYYGRIVDFEINSPGLDERVLAPSGGLWWKDPNLPAAARPRPLADNVPTFAMGSFATHPSDPNTILLGTGTPILRSGFDGLGLWRTTDAGANWTQIAMDPQDPENEPKGFYRLRYDRFNFDRVHAATTNGYWRSDNGGLTWDKIEEGAMTDFAQHPFLPNVVFLAEWGCTNCSDGGLFKSESGGDAGSWVRVTTGGLPSNDVGRGSIAIGGLTVNLVSLYVSFASASQPFDMMGVYRSDDLGANWTDITPPPDSSFKNAHRNNAIATDPTDPGKVMLGWISLWRTENGLSAAPNWTEITHSEGPSPGTIHPDVWYIRWADDGSWVGAATDGGLYISTDDGLNWRMAERVPVTQFYHIDVDPTDPSRMVGGSQDNGIAATENAGVLLDWQLRQSGDGGGVAVQNLVLNPIWVVFGVDPLGDLTFRQLFSLDLGVTWEVKEEGMLPSDQWIRKVRTPRSGNQITTVVTAAGCWIYQRDQPNQIWINLNEGEPFRNLMGNPVDIQDITIVDEVGDIMWITTKTDGLNDERVIYRDAQGNFHDRSSGLPVGYVGKVAGDRYGSDPLLGYALMMGLSDDIKGARIWRTTDAGLNWENITGNLPDVSVADLVEFPNYPNILYVASEFGCFKTTTALDPNPIWFRWMAGMPRAVDVREFVPYFDNQTDEFWIYAGSYGRSAWRRNIAAGGSSTPAPEPRGASFLKAPWPNPFGSSTTIRYRLAERGTSELAIHDLRGRIVRRWRLEDEPGWHSLTWDGDDQRERRVAAGVYFAVLNTGGQSYRQRITYVP